MSDSIPAAQAATRCRSISWDFKNQAVLAYKQRPRFPLSIRFTKRCVLFPTASLDEYLRVKQAQEAAL